MTRSEQAVFDLCRRSCLSRWCHANPIKSAAGPAKELCDVLVVFENAVVVFSVKEIAYPDTGDPELDFKRWTKRALKHSMKQLSGAERWLLQGHGVNSDAGEPVALPAPQSMKVHRILVALGAEGRAPVLSSGPKSTVHILDEVSLPLFLGELDTVGDFLDYLRASTELEHSNTRLVVTGGEHNVLAFYLSNNRSLPTDVDLITLDEGLWEQFSSSDAYRRRKEADRVSYFWE